MTTKFAGGWKIITWSSFFRSKARQSTDVQAPYRAKPSRCSPKLRLSGRDPSTTISAPAAGRGDLDIWSDFDEDLFEIDSKAFHGLKSERRRLSKGSRKKRAQQDEQMCGQQEGRREPVASVSTADLEAQLDHMYSTLGQPLEHSGKDVWARAAGYDPAGVRSVPMGPVLIRPVPCNMTVAFNDGVVEWKNALMLPVNVGGSQSRRGNRFLEGGSKISWFPGASHVPGSAMMARLVPNSEADPSVPVLLYCRAGKSSPYVFCGELGDVEILEENNRRIFVWTLLDFDALIASSDHFKNIVIYADVCI